MDIWAVVNWAFLLRGNVLFWSNAPVSLVVQAVEGSLDNYLKYQEIMGHLYGFWRPYHGEETRIGMQGSISLVYHLQCT